MGKEKDEEISHGHGRKHSGGRGWWKVLFGSHEGTKRGKQHEKREQEHFHAGDEAAVTIASSKERGTAKNSMANGGKSRSFSAASGCSFPHCELCKSSTGDSVKDLSAWKCLDAFDTPKQMPREKEMWGKEAHARPAVPEGGGQGVPEKGKRRTRIRASQVKWESVDDLRRSKAYLEAWSTAYTATLYPSPLLKQTGLKPIVGMKRSASDESLSSHTAKRHLELLPGGAASKGQQQWDASLEASDHDASGASSPESAMSGFSDHTFSSQSNSSKNTPTTISPRTPEEELSLGDRKRSEGRAASPSKRRDARNGIEPIDSSSYEADGLMPEPSNAYHLKLGVVCTLAAIGVVGAAIIIGGVASRSMGGSFRYGAHVSIAWAGMAFAIAVVSSCLWALWQFALGMEVEAGGVMGKLRKLHGRKDVAASTKEQFLSGCSRDIRIPLNGMIGSLGSLKASANLPPQVKGALDSALESSLSVANWLANFMRGEVEVLPPAEHQRPHQARAKPHRMKKLPGGRASQEGRGSNHQGGK